MEAGHRKTNNATSGNITQLIPQWQSIAHSMDDTKRVAPRTIGSLGKILKIFPRPWVPLQSVAYIIRERSIFRRKKIEMKKREFERIDMYRIPIEVQKFYQRVNINMMALVEAHSSA